MDLKRILEQDKKLLVKVIAGVVLLAVAFAFYLIKESASDRDQSITVIPGSIAENGQTESSDAASSAQATKSAIEKEITIMVDVGGAVAVPSVVELPEGSRVFQAIEKAGGLTKDADTESINQAEILTDGQKIYIPTKQEVKEGLGRPTSIGFASNSGSGSGSGQSKLVNINTADSQALQQLSGVGPATAEKIINYRNENGKFKNIEEIKNVSGIGDKTFDKFKDKITI